MYSYTIYNDEGQITVVIHKMDTFEIVPFPRDFSTMLDAIRFIALQEELGAVFANNLEGVA